MTNLRFRAGYAFAAALLWSASPVTAQQPASSGSELYHVHVVKAAAGKLPQLIAEYESLAGQDGQSALPPIILRHRQGGEWDLMVVTARGRQATITADAPTAAEQAANQRRAVLADWHGDTFVVGPAWDTVQKALLPSGGTQQSVYGVSDYRAVPGHRQQLQEVLETARQSTPGRSVLFSHVEGAPWNFLEITRFDSWAELGAFPPASSGQDQGLSMREHLAVHHDTIASHVPAGQAMR